MTVYDVPRSSMESQHPSLQKRGSLSSSSIGNYHNHLLRRHSQDQDSGYHSVNNTPLNLAGPPVRLDKHPSFRQKRDSEASMRSYSNTSSPPCGSYHDTELFDCDQDAIIEGPVMGHMDGMEAGQGQHQYDRVLPHGRHHSHPHTHFQALAPEVDPEDADDQYMRMTSRTANMKDGTYVYMRSASFSESSSSSSSSVPMPQAGNMTAAEYNTLQHFPSNQRPSSRQLVTPASYETLPTISETKHVPIPRRDDYQNHPLPQELHGIMPRNYRPNYENRDTASFRGQRGLHTQDSYENVPQEGSPLNSNNSNNAGPRRLSMRRRTSEREEVSILNSSSSSSPKSLPNSSEQPRRTIMGH